MKELLTFDDVLIQPSFSTLTSRSEVDLHTRLVSESRLIDNWSLPVMSSNMDTITGVEMAKAIMTYGGLS